MIVKVLDNCQRLPLMRTKYREVMTWVRAVLKGHDLTAHYDDGTSHLDERSQYGMAHSDRGTSHSDERSQYEMTHSDGEASHSDERSQYGMTHSGGTDAVTLLIRRIIAEAETEVALETVAKGTETDAFHPELKSKTGMQQSQSVIGPSHIVPQLSHSMKETSQSHATSEGSLELRSSSGFQPSSPSSGEATPTSLLERCVYGVAVCSVRCPAYYKALYRLAATLHSLGHSQASDPCTAHTSQQTCVCVCVCFRWPRACYWGLFLGLWCVHRTNYSLCLCSNPTSLLSVTTPSVSE